MKLANPNFIGFDGTPQTGQVPPTLIVGGEVALSAEQESEVRHAYKLFCDANRLALGSFQMRHLVLRDGTRVRMESNNGIDTVMVWPTGGGRITYTFRGFVFAPMAVSPATIDAKLDTTILAFVDNDMKWKPFLSPYHPGAKREALQYYVTGTEWAGRQVHLDRAGYTVWENTPVHNVRPIGDAKYNDVFATKGAALYRNGVKFKGLGASPGGVPVALPVDSDYVPVFVSDTRVAGVVDAAVSVGYDWAAYFAPIASGVTFQAGAALIAGPKAAYIGYNRLSNEAVQIWTAVAPLAAAAPFVGTPFQAFVQIDPPLPLNSNDTFVTTSVALQPAAIVNPLSLVVGFMWGGSDVVYTGPMMSGTPTYNGYAQKKEFNKHYAEADTFAIDDVNSATINRYVDIVSSTIVNATTTERTCPVTRIFAYPPPDCVYGMYPADFGGIDTVFGDPMGPAVEYNSVSLDHSDTSVCVVTVPPVPDAIWSVSVTHRIVGDQKDAYEHPPNYTPGGYLSGSPAGRTPPNIYTLITSPGRATEEHYSFERTDTHALDGTARDYFYADRTNGVFGWLETHIASSSTKLPDTAATGTSSIVVTLKITAPGVTYSRVLFTRDFAVPVDLSLQVPWGINFAGSLLSFSFHAPPRPAPIFAPVWQEQGLCPYIAYTAVGEPGARTAAFFRLQMQRTFPPPGYEPPTFAQCASFRPFMFEQMVADYGSAWGTGSSDAMDAVFGAPIILRVSSPDSLLFDNIFNPLDDTTECSLIYRV